MTTACTRRVLLGATALGLVMATSALPQTPSRPAARPELPKQGPRLEPVAETKLLMEGLAQANFRGLEKLLQKKPADADSWSFARGQALLIAETGNLLMLRPPRNSGQTVWMDRSTDLRTAASRLARDLANQDFERGRASLAEVANSCNRCHQTFRVPARITPFAEPVERGVSAP